MPNIGTKLSVFRKSETNDFVRETLKNSMLFFSEYWLKIVELALETSHRCFTSTKELEFSFSTANWEEITNPSSLTVRIFKSNINSYLDIVKVRELPANSTLILRSLTIGNEYELAINSHKSKGTMVAKTFILVTKISNKWCITQIRPGILAYPDGLRVQLQAKPVSRYIKKAQAMEMGFEWARVQE